MDGAWLVCLEDLPPAGGHWRGEIDRANLARSGEVDGLEGLNADVRFELRLVRRGDVWRLSGEWHAGAERDCDRCNRRFDWPFGAAVSRDYRLTASPSGEDGEAEWLAPPGRIDLLDVLREEMWLAWDASVVCDARCKGLCPRCGRDLNDGDCGCGEPEPAEDHPFAALRRLKLDA